LIVPGPQEAFSGVTALLMGVSMFGSEVRRLLTLVVARLGVSLLIRLTAGLGIVLVWLLDFLLIAFLADLLLTTICTALGL
jgi:hypothetical protein